MDSNNGNLDQNLNRKIHLFFEEPETQFAKLVQLLIFLLILISVALVVVEFFFQPLYLKYKVAFDYIDYFVLGIFTVEYFLRVGTAIKKLKFITRPINIVDFVAIFPSYLELVLPLFISGSNLRALRIIRILRFTRILRFAKIFRFSGTFKKILRFKHTILEAIAPVILFFIITKLGFWYLEYHQIWQPDVSLEQLFAIVGFAMGIILSQKIGASYKKFLQVDIEIIKLCATMRSLTMILNKFTDGLGTTACNKWLTAFYKSIIERDSRVASMDGPNSELYKTIYMAEHKAPAHLSMLHGEISRQAAFCISRKLRPTPLSYDVLLQKATLLYLLLMALFIPGLTGLISVVVVTYILYGMYYLTQDFDNFWVDEFDLISINLTELEELVGIKPHINVPHGPTTG